SFCYWLHLLFHYSSPMFVLFSLFQCSGALVHLHSFPTRRSSDLRRRCRCGAGSPPGAASARAMTPSGGAAPRWNRKAATPAAGRSEEHTSELQSHLNLVCRLLLEKKKNKVKKRNSATIKSNCRYI